MSIFIVVLFFFLLLPSFRRLVFKALRALLRVFGFVLFIPVIICTVIYASIKEANHKRRY
ncbi:hypothetical protein CPT_Pollock8 [Escherichia phage Pollock]|uniref:Uncharacterized protein n=1 Tax=Escherichia phage Pollock TaxID=1540097 RepID=A0A0A0YRG9_9CAUD|nr:hypothetical protein ACQ44_gp08 [Escherichia phage Pollock]AIX12367.1 hypothetical protein CPT_Pollock8 [Escherichia phage Pollock]